MLSRIKSIWSATTAPFVFGLVGSGKALKFNMEE